LKIAQNLETKAKVSIAKAAKEQQELEATKQEQI
jgi:hypothetical protein